MSELSLGEKRVRSAFNPSGVGNVNCIENDTAKLINVCEEMRPKEGKVVKPGDSEKIRLISLAQTAYEEAGMWAVKAATFEQ